jgi:transketolase
MGMADIAVALWARHLKHNPGNPGWYDRDRFVLSNGHGSMLLYSLLHLSGYDLPISELQNFRQLHSRTPGHPEVGITPGVETTTGPLGQGISNAVGFALAEKLLAKEFNQPGFPLVDHNTYVFAGDGCLMEGVSHEACALAGTWQLSKLVVMWDDNGISIDGDTKHWFSEDVVKRYEAYGWNVIRDIDGHDIWAVDTAIAMAKDWARNGRDGKFAPTLIQCKTTIGKFSPTRAGTSKAHGEPLGAQELAGARAAMNWQYAPFEIPQSVMDAWDARESGAQAQALWDDMMRAYTTQFPVLAQAFNRRMSGDLPADWSATVAALLESATQNREPMGTRKASQAALNVLGPALGEMLGGSADLTGSNNTDWKGVTALRTGTTDDGQWVPGRHINYGVREFGMSAIANGLALHNGFLPYVATFLTFSDYSRNALRMAALMKLRVGFVFTHDSIGLGEDGPTHQSVEHTASLRLIPNMDVWRPADTVESAQAWVATVERRNGPSCLLFSRQNCVYLERNSEQTAAIRKGAYVLRDPVKGAPVAVILATGSEVQLALAAADLLANDGIGVRVVSVPCTNVFDRQDVTYKRQVLPDNLPRVAVEAGVTDGWWKYGCAAVLGVDSFGESAPAPAVFKHFGLTADNLANVVRDVL